MTEVDAIEATQDALRRGDLIVAYDLARQTLGDNGSDARLAYLAVLALARTGATERAINAYADLKLKERMAGTTGQALRRDIAALEARLLKDRALAARGPDRGAALADAARAYQRVFEGDPDAFPGVNAATLWCLAGDRARAEEIARCAVRLCAGRDGDSAEATYYLRASEAEAALILGDVGACQRALEAGAKIGGGHHAAFATTRRQLHLLCTHLGIDPAILAPLAAPKVVHFAGHRIGDRFPASEEAAVRGCIDALFREHGVGFGYGALASGADIVFAEALLAAGHELQLVLPFEIGEFKAVSVCPSGDGWVQRFERCLDGAANVTFATDDQYLGDDSLFAYAGQLAMGLALVRARNLDAEARQMVVWDGVTSDRLGLPAGTAVDVATWQRRGLPIDIVSPGDGAPRLVGDSGLPKPAKDAREVRAMLFGDVRGFSKLHEAQLPIFLAEILGRFAKVLDECGDGILFRNTWGDGLYAVASDVSTAADCALRLQEEMAGLDPVSKGLPSDLALRVGCHVGPVFPVDDPVLRRRNYLGSHVSRTARIEPITPAGEVYVTEAFAAGLALDAPTRFTTAYVGQVPAAKNYGKMRMHYLKRAASV